MVIRASWLPTARSSKKNVNCQLQFCKEIGRISLHTRLFRYGRTPLSIVKFVSVPFVTLCAISSQSDWSIGISEDAMRPKWYVSTRETRTRTLEEELEEAVKRTVRFCTNLKTVLFERVLRLDSKCSLTYYPQKHAGQAPPTPESPRRRSAQRKCRGAPRKLSRSRQNPRIQTHRSSKSRRGRCRLERRRYGNRCWDTGCWRRLKQ